MHQFLVALTFFRYPRIFIRTRASMMCLVCTRTTCVYIICTQFTMKGGELRDTTRGGGEKNRARNICTKHVRINPFLWVWGEKTDGQSLWIQTRRRSHSLTLHIRAFCLLCHSARDELIVRLLGFFYRPPSCATCNPFHLLSHLIDLYCSRGQDVAAPRWKRTW